MSDEIIDEKPETGAEMGFWDHLDEFRKRIINGLVSIILTSILAAVFIEKIMKYVLLKPATDVHLELQNLKPFGQQFLYFKVILVVGIILASPVILYQIWKFIEPGLYQKEKKWARSITVFTSLCFASGVAFSYYVIIPTMLAFTSTFGTTEIKNSIDVNEYFSFITMMLLATGVMFEMPMITFVLTKVGILSSKLLKKFWRHAFVVILIIAAVATPTPDPISQLIFAAPLFILYFLSIWISIFVEKGKEIASKSTPNT